MVFHEVNLAVETGRSANTNGVRVEWRFLRLCVSLGWATSAGVARGAGGELRRGTIPA